MTNHSYKKKLLSITTFDLVYGNSGYLSCLGHGSFQDLTFGNTSSTLSGFEEVQPSPILGIDPPNKQRQSWIPRLLELENGIDRVGFLDFSNQSFVKVRKLPAHRDNLIEAAKMMQPGLPVWKHGECVMLLWLQRRHE